MSSEQNLKTASFGKLWNDPDLGALLTTFPFTLFMYGSDENDARKWVEETFEGNVAVVQSLEEKVGDGPQPFVVSSQILENYELGVESQIYDFVNKDEDFVWKKKDGSTTTIKKGQARIILNFGEHKELDFGEFIKKLHNHLEWDEIGILNIPVYSTREVYNCV